MRVFLAFACAAVAVAAVAVEHGFAAPPVSALLLRPLQIILPWVALLVWGDVQLKALPPKRWRNLIGLLGELMVLTAAVVELAGWLPGGEALAVAAAVTFAVRLNSYLARSMANPPLLFPASFLVLIAISTCLLKLPAATPTDQPISWIDAAFTATSAVCVTGLAVRDTASDFTFFGQAVILGSIQVGGLGVMIFGSTLALLFGARMSFREHVTLSAALDEYPAHRIMRFAWFIVLTTFALEAIGAAVLYLSWPADQLGDHPQLWHAVFHSISAFCNAGFDITGQSMVGFRSHPAAYLGIMPLIILGGVGFIVLENVYHVAKDRLQRKPRARRLTTHTKIVLTTTALLLVGGFGIILLAQSVAGGALTGQGALDAAFMSTTARTAGFTTVPMNELSSGSRFTLMVLMAVGGSPGSTAGGMKTIVFALMVLAVISTVRGRAEVEVFRRSLPDALVKKAATVAAGLVGVIALATLALDITERIPFEPLLFEVISAATTTGLSLGATGELSPIGRVVITITMFLGRVGALSLISSLMGASGGGSTNGRYAYPRDSVSLG